MLAVTRMGTHQILWEFDRYIPMRKFCVKFLDPYFQSAHTLA